MLPLDPRSASAPGPPQRDTDELFLNHPVPLWVYERATLRFLAVNDAAILQYGYPREQFLRMTLDDIRPDLTDGERARLTGNPGRRRSWRQSGICQVRTGDGRIIHAEITSHDLTFAGVPAVAVAAYDITDRLVAEAAARDAERRLKEAQQLASLGSWRWDLATDAVVWSDELFRIFGLPPGSTAPRFADQRGLYAVSDWPLLQAAVAHSLETGEPYERQIRVKRSDGTERFIIARGAVVRNDEGRIVAMHGTAHDVTERCERDAQLEAAHEQLSDSEARYRELVENLDDVVFSVDTSGVIQYVSSSVKQYGYSPADLTGKPFLSVVHPDDIESATASFAETLAGCRKKREFRVFDKAGNVREVRSSNRVQMKDGVPVSVSGVLIDLTEQKRAQEQLKSASRLEAVGRLAGGVAHDFNNLLVAINGFAELALTDVPESSSLHADLTEIVKAGKRAAALTAQLLAFSRRQVLRPDSVSLNDVVQSMEPMLRRLIGEDVELVIESARDLQHVRIDTGHLEQVIMNLVVNARDAMPDGGTLRISTSDTGFPVDELPEGLAPSNVTVLTVSDTGQGMDSVTREQIFEPFFTTKPPGQGTGLGLAMVYGFVRQSGGAISVRSSPGAGATFRIALPGEQSAVASAARTAPTVERGTETILVTEDETTVRTLVRRVLERAGYRVLTAETPDEALRICRSDQGPIDLLLTDVVMPQMRGTMLADRALAIRPSMRVLFMSGYSGTEKSHRSLADEGVPFLQKPFSAGVLSEAVRAALAGHPGSSAAQPR
jgi:PAS domain S-box-containing protein